MLKYLDEVSPHQISWLFKLIPLFERSLFYPEHTLQLLIEDIEKMAWHKGHLDICILFNDLDLTKDNIHCLMWGDVLCSGPDCHNQLHLVMQIGGPRRVRHVVT